MILVSLKRKGENVRIGELQRGDRFKFAEEDDDDEYTLVQEDKDGQCTFRDPEGTDTDCDSEEEVVKL